MFEEGSQSFFQSKFQLLGEEQSHWEVPEVSQKFKQYQHQSLSHPKSIKQYGFMKKYKRINSLFPYVSTIRPTSLETTFVNNIIYEIYEEYLKFFRKGGWKCHDLQTHLQEFFISSLYSHYPHIGNLKKVCSHFDKFLLCFCYTLNYLKTCSPFIRTFTSFLNGTYCLGELFIYLSLRNISREEEGVQKVSSMIIRKVLKILEQQCTDSNISFSEQIKSSINDEDKDKEKEVNLNTIFCQPTAGVLNLGSVKIYRIMKVCKVIEQDKKFKIKNSSVEEGNMNWDQFLQLYFNKISETQINFEHILAASVSESLYQLAESVFGKGSSQKRDSFLEEGFSYVFSILELIFFDKNYQNVSNSIEDKKTIGNLTYLREMYQKAKTLHCYDIVVTKRFSKTILKNGYLLRLFKKYK